MWLRPLISAALCRPVSARGCILSLAPRDGLHRCHIRYHDQSSTQRAAELQHRREEAHQPAGRFAPGSRAPISLRPNHSPAACCCSAVVAPTVGRAGHQVRHPRPDLPAPKRPEPPPCLHGGFRAWLRPVRDPALGRPLSSAPASERSAEAPQPASCRDRGAADSHRPDRVQRRRVRERVAADRDDVSSSPPTVAGDRLRPGATLGGGYVVRSAT